MTNHLHERILKSVDELREDLLSFTASTVAVDSVTGYEDKVQPLYQAKLEELGLQVDAWNPQPEDVADFPNFLSGETRFGERPNIVGVWKGTGAGPSIGLNGHVDVVLAGEEARWTHPPFSGARADGKIWGRGACDMKAGVAAGIFAIAALQRAGVALDGDVQMQCVIAEETGGLGTIATIRRGYVPDGLICLEPTNLNICPAMGGLLKYQITILGRAAHTSRPWMGESAFEHFLPIYQAVKDFETERHNQISHPLFDSLPRKAPIAMGKIHAGDWPYSIPERLVAAGRCGMVPGDDPEDVRARFEQCIYDAAAKDPWLQEHPPIIEWVHGQFDPWETPADHPLVEAVRASTEEVTHQPPQFKPITGGVDAAFFVKYAQVPSVTFGPGDMTLAHHTDENVPEDDLVAATKIVALSVLQWCGASNA
ncbi:MAG: ArgE/DapE family deacylase [Thermomicrobiales bacterium]|nr:ArgE/DapE family deacylase [Thermomicrobiales bacterium]MCO5221357.1 ArgE/DapE family deacylase [Thermomicrobiales bacterium]